MSAYEHLSRDVLRKVMGGMLLTYYRSRHPRGESSLQVAGAVPIEHDGYEVDADITIVNRHTRQIAAIFQLLAPRQELHDVTVSLERLRAYLDDHPSTSHQVELGVVVPESRESEVAVLREVFGPHLQLVTYPA